MLDSSPPVSVAGSKKSANGFPLQLNLVTEYSAGVKVSLIFDSDMGANAIYHDVEGNPFVVSNKEGTWKAVCAIAHRH